MSQELDEARAEAQRAGAEARVARIDARLAQQQLKELETHVSRGAHEHDGFFLRFRIGPGIGGFRGIGPVLGAQDPWETSAAGMFAISLGSCTDENVALHGDFWSMSDLALRGGDYDEPVRDWSMLGFGFTYHVMPLNAYLSGSVGLAVSTLSYKPDDYTTVNSDVTAGIGLGFVVGKEWWVSDNWGLGLASQTLYSYTTSDAFSLHHAGAGLLFSATYN